MRLITISVTDEEKLEISSHIAGRQFAGRRERIHTAPGEYTAPLDVWFDVAAAIWHACEVQTTPTRASAYEKIRRAIVSKA